MIGIDEVGRGAWAGPLLVVAARFKTNLPAGLKDSKKLTARARQKLLPQINQACDLGEGWVSSQEIDLLGLTKAMELGVTRALEAVTAKVDEEIIMDGLINYCPARYKNVKTIARADNLWPIVSAASIYAKVLRDEFMTNLGQKYEKYRFDQHVGYGTALHREMLTFHGITDIHRLSFQPIKKFAKL